MPLKFRLITLLLILGINQSVSAQELQTSKSSKHRIGLILGYGDQNIGLEVDYFYEVYFFQPQYYYALIDKKGWGLEILAQPQFNLTSFRPIDNEPEVLDGFEYGVNAGLLVRKNLFNKFLSFYAFISAGPHFVSGVPQRQTDGFIFSDNFFVGMNIKLNKRFQLDLRPGLRHISNAGIQNPNGGVNNSVISGGFIFDFY